LPDLLQVRLVLADPGNRDARVARARAGAGPSGRRETVGAWGRIAETARRNPPDCGGDRGAGALPWLGAGAAARQSGAPVSAPVRD